MTTRIAISLHNGGNNKPVGIVVIDDTLSEKQVADIANESGGLADLVAMGDWDGPENYEWTGDEVYEVLK